MSALLSPHLRHMRAAGRAPATTIHDRERLLIQADQALPHGIDNAEPAEIEAFLASGNWAPWTRFTYYNHLSAFYDWACGGREPWLTWNPMDELARPRTPDATPHPVSDEELAHALANSDERWQRVIALAAYAGLRASEIRRCQRGDITAERIRIVAGKGGRTAEVPTHEEIWRRVEHLPIGTSRNPVPAAVPSSTRLSTRAREHFDRIGLPDVHLHRFRHWYATALLRGGADIVTVKELMRHRSIQTTAAYLALVDGQRRLAISTLPVLHGSQPQTAGPQQNAA